MYKKEVILEVFKKVQKGDFDGKVSLAFKDKGYFHIFNVSNRYKGILSSFIDSEIIESKFEDLIIKLYLEEKGFKYKRNLSIDILNNEIN